MSGKSHLEACIEEHKYTSFYMNHKNSEGEISLSRMELHNGYSRSGKYYGVGAPLFCVEIDIPTTSAIEITEMRGSSENGAKSRAALRAALQKLYPNMKVNR